MKKLMKKGFTIVELVIVIAVIAILTAVLIPTISSVTQKAQVSADTQLIKLLNTSLKADEAKNGKPKYMQQALDIVAADGFDVAKINAKASKNSILWDSVNNAFCYLKDGELEYVPNSVRLELNVDNYKLWTIASAPDTTYSTYLYNVAPGVTFNSVHTGIDVGNEKVASIEYISGAAGNTTGQRQEVVFHTNGGALTINAKNDSVKHYGEGSVLTITAIANASYHEFGHFPKATIAQGRIVVEEQGQIQVLDASGATAAVEVEKQGNGKINNVVKGENTNVTVEQELTPNIATMTTVTTWSALKTEVESGSNKVIAFNASNDENDLATISISRSVTIFGNGKTMSANFNTALSETTTYKGRYDGLFNITGSNIEVLIDNINLKQNGSKGTALNINEVANNTNVTYTNSTLGSKQYVIATDISNNSHNLRLDNISFDITSFNSIYWRTSNSSIVANNCAFCATVQNSAGTGSNTFGVIVICEPFYKQMNNTTADYLMQNNTITLNGGTIVAKDKALDTTAEIAIYSSYNNKVYLNDTNYNEYTTMLVIVKHNIKSSSYANNSEPTFESSTGSFIYINGESADGKLNAHHCVMYPNNNYAGGNIPCFAGTTTQNPSTYYDGQDYRPLYGYQVIDNGNGTWTYRKAN